MQESMLRSILKSFTFRILASAFTALTFFVFTNDHSLALGFGALDFFSKLVLFYLHERAWLRVPESSLNKFRSFLKGFLHVSFLPFFSIRTKK